MRGTTILVVYGLFCFGLIAGCSGAASTAPPPEDPVPVPAPPGEPVSFLELVPPGANGGALVHVTRLRASSHGSALTAMVRRLGAYDWEQALELDLRTQIEQALIFGIADTERGPGDLSQVLDTLRESSLGAVVELRGDAVAGEGTCTDQMLASLEGRELQEPAEGMLEFRCGRFIIVKRADLDVPLGPHSVGPLAQVLGPIIEGDAASTMIFAAVAGPEMINRVSCNDETVQLAGWQQARIELGDGMRMRGRYHAADAADVSRLQNCVGDGMGGFANVPLFSQLALSDVLEDADITPDADQPSDVLLEASFSEGELDLMLGLLELVGSGMTEQQEQ